MKIKHHLLIFYGIYGFFAFLAFEIQRPRRPKLISMKSEATLFYIFCYLLRKCLTKMAAKRANKFSFSLRVNCYQLLKTYLPFKDYCT